MIKSKMIETIINLTELEKKDYFKPVRVNSFCSNYYIGYGK